MSETILSCPTVGELIKLLKKLPPDAYWWGEDDGTITFTSRHQLPFYEVSNGQWREKEAFNGEQRSTGA